MYQIISFHTIMPTPTTNVLSETYVPDLFLQMMDVTIRKLVLEKTELERDLAHACNHMGKLVPGSSPVQDQD